MRAYKSFWPVLLLLSLVLACERLAPAPWDGDDGASARVLGERLRDSYTLRDGYYESPSLDSTLPVTRAGFMIEVALDREAAPLYPEARGLDADGQPGPWQPVVFTWEEHPLRVAHADLGFEAVAAQIRIPELEVEAYVFVQWQLFVPMQASAPYWEPDAVSLRNAEAQQQALATSLANGGVLSRAAWGARATRCTSLNSSKTKVTVHHTVTATTVNGSYEANLRQIQAYHMDARGYCDVGYTFFVTADGRTWEAREAKYLGAHVANQNTNNLGVTFVGCFHTSDCSSLPPQTPPAAMVQGGGKLIGLLARDYGISVSSSSVVGHRDLAATACPGTNLYAQMGTLRSVASSGGTTTPPPPATPTKGSIKGVVWDLAVTAGPSDLGNLRLTAATVRSSSGASSGVRSDDAYWSFELDPGTYTITASATGYAESSRSVQVTAGSETWASIGLSPVPTSAELTFHVHDQAAGQGASLDGATVQVVGQAAQLTSVSGEVHFTLSAGSATVRTSKDGYEPDERSISVVGGHNQRIEIALSAVTSVVTEPPPGEPPPEQPPVEEPPLEEPPAGPGLQLPAPVAQLELANSRQHPVLPGAEPSQPSQKASLGPVQGFSCSSAGEQRSSLTAGLLLLGALLARRRLKVIR
ncbi:MAG: N-acetylmuramoyl-L-alanine amidase [Pseudomonadota bacterium]